MVGIGTDKRIYVIQRIEQEMRIQLVPQILEFRFRLPPFRLFSRIFRLQSPTPELDGNSYSNHKRQ